MVKSGVIDRMNATQLVLEDAAKEVGHLRFSIIALSLSGLLT
eukprot:CAMPEP_0185621156 /NCGR_PEP_ID=MMETSP0436-20130131/56374_1 /TAXON_ID=626734 ORGANISM="Favella taraikaensis, Strain Fe Narragansett Bay" /NCGR_SAMPLE_ID=MMETSP0436 /ASSEMBLY_ACC=CAM_ASM_000390 /LENGTH=41 /DNA_ID= /DNA_START= /DNA_END= /DNA_ORIENTATION=